MASQLDLSQINLDRSGTQPLVDQVSSAIERWIQGGSIDCLCHGSQFSIVDGSVQGGPAPAPLPEKTVTVTGTTLTVS